MTYALHQGDCLAVLPTIEAGSIDAIITDLPYGTTACSWDEIIPFAPMWGQVKRVLKPRGVFVTTASQPFTSKLIMSNLDWFKHELIWEKEQGTNQFLKDIAPLKKHENVLIFGDGKVLYNPQMVAVKRQRAKRKATVDPITGATINGYQFDNLGMSYPVSIFFAQRELAKRYHPTQKPVALYEYLIKTYTNEGDTVLDFCMGSGTTGVACMNTGRKFIGVEKEQKYFEISERRIKQASEARQLELV